METRLYTVHHKGSGGIRVVADRFDGFALALPPLWAVWHGLWITLAGQVLLVALAALAAFFVMGRSWMSAAAIAWIAMAIVGAGLVWGVAQAFDRFDVSADTPA